jgi:colanic acid/amylovoran biosynthesis glycosyltransferase
MKKLCIIKGHVPLISETFIDTHTERLSGEKVVLYNYFPDYIFNGHTIRPLYSCRPWRRRLLRLLPMAIYDRIITPRHNHPHEVRDFLYAFFRQHRVDCILAEYGMNGADICPIARELGIPLIVHFHGHDAHRIPDVLPYQDKYKEMFEYAQTIISVSHLMTRKLTELGAPANKILYNPYGAREYFFDVKPDYRPTLIAVGRFAEIKAPYLTVAAFREALQQVPDARLVMIGDGHLLECCRSLAIAWKIADCIKFTGPLTHDQFLPLLSQACGFVQHSVTPSWGDAEGTPNSVLEAQAAGLPVISTRHAGICEAVVDGKTGFLVEERDINGMATHMIRLLRDSQLARTMGTEARSHTKTHYGIDRHLRLIEEKIREARSLSNSSSSAKTD